MNAPNPTPPPATPEGEATAPRMFTDEEYKHARWLSAWLNGTGSSDEDEVAYILPEIRRFTRSAVEAKTKELEAENAALADLIHKAIDTLDGNEEPIAWREGGPELLRKLSESLEAQRVTLDAIESSLLLSEQRVRALERALTYEAFEEALKGVRDDAGEMGSADIPAGYEEMPPEQIAVADECWRLGLRSMETAILNRLFDYSRAALSKGPADKGEAK